MSSLLDYDSWHTPLAKILSYSYGLTSEEVLMKEMDHALALDQEMESIQQNERDDLSISLQEFGESTDQAESYPDVVIDIAPPASQILETPTPPTTPTPSTTPTPPTICSEDMCPKNKHDIERLRAVIAAGPEAAEPILEGLLNSTY